MMLLTDGNDNDVDDGDDGSDSHDDDGDDDNMSAVIAHRPALVAKHTRGAAWQNFREASR